MLPHVLSLTIIIHQCSHSPPLLSPPPQGVLYELITDMGYLDEHGHVWQSLVDVSGDGEYFDSQFRCRSKMEFDLGPTTAELE